MRGVGGGYPKWGGRVFLKQGGGFNPSMNYANSVLKIIWHRLCDILLKLEMITAIALNFHNRHDFFC